MRGKNLRSYLISGAPGVAGCVFLIVALVRRDLLLAAMSLAPAVSGGTAVVVTKYMPIIMASASRKISGIQRVFIIGIFWGASLWLDIFVAQRIFR